MAEEIFAAIIAGGVLALGSHLWGMLRAPILLSGIHRYPRKVGRRRCQWWPEGETLMLEASGHRRVRVGWLHREVHTISVGGRYILWWNAEE